MPRPLPEDLYTGQIGRETKADLQQFRDGEIDRKEVHRRVRTRIELAMNSITAGQEADPIAQKLDTPNKAIWRTWFRELGGTYWTVPENMPEAARDPWADYCHYRNNPSPTSEERKAQAAKDFTAATGFDAEEVFKFKCSLNKK